VGHITLLKKEGSVVKSPGSDSCSQGHNFGLNTSSIISLHSRGMGAKTGGEGGAEGAKASLRVLIKVKVWTRGFQILIKR